MFAPHPANVIFQYRIYFPDLHKSTRHVKVLRVVAADESDDSIKIPR